MGVHGHGSLNFFFVFLPPRTLILSAAKRAPLSYRLQVLCVIHISVTHRDHGCVDERILDLLSTEWLHTSSIDAFDSFCCRKRAGPLTQLYRAGARPVLGADWHLDSGPWRGLLRVRPRQRTEVWPAELTLHLAIACLVTWPLSSTSSPNGRRHEAGVALCLPMCHFSLSLPWRSPFSPAHHWRFLRATVAICKVRLLFPFLLLRYATTA